MAIDSAVKKAGILVPVFALRREGDLGIGDTLAVIEAIDFCAHNEIRVLQLLPVNETGGDHSPYNAISSVALDPVYITLTPEQVPGLTSEDLGRLMNKDELRRDQSGPVHYAAVKVLKLHLLAAAFVHFEESHLDAQTDLARELAAFKKENAHWLTPYSLFRTLVNEHEGNATWIQWAEEMQTWDGAEAWLKKSPHRESLERTRELYIYIQWVAFRQWTAVKAHADKRRVALMGDIPFGISRFSADVWAHRGLFDLEWSGGAPPEKFFKTDPFTEQWGQNWGIPLYDWPSHAAENYSWWRQRVELTARVFHAFRIDHVLGFFRIYSFPWAPWHNQEFTGLTLEQAAEKTEGRLPQFITRSDEKPEDAAKNEAFGRHVLEIILEAAGPTWVVAEDLGMVPDYVRPLLQKLGIPGFTIPQFERVEADRSYKPAASQPVLSLATYATHDHSPLIAWYEDLVTRWHGPNGHESWLEVQRLMIYIGWNPENPPTAFTPELHQALLAKLMHLPCWLVVCMITDVLGTAQRYNEPGSASDSNWSQRLDHPLAAYEMDTRFASKIRQYKELIVSTRRNQ